jgi:aryl-alcohol dehydrogenase-like predicted oxidoreductase
MILPRILGRSGIKVSALGMGCWAIGGPFWVGETPCGWGKVDDRESIRAIHAALDLGVYFFDTANVYGAGHSERVLGQAMVNRRAQVVIATKFNSLFDETTRQITGSDANPAGIRAALEDSLHRLGTDYVDLYLFHDGGFPVDHAAPVRDTLEELAVEGKIRAYGWSTDSTDRAAFFARGSSCAAMEVEVNVLEPKAAMLALCEASILAVIDRGPLAMGLLTDKYTSASRVSIDDVRGEKSPGWMKYYSGGKPDPRWLSLRDAVRDILTSEGRTLAQGALAWLWARSPQNIPIPGFRTVRQVEENCAALQFGPLQAGQMNEIDVLLGRA